MSTEPQQRKIEETYPLSPLQHGMLFHNLLKQASGVDIEQIVCTLPEELDHDTLEKAWQEVACRHSILRTAFEWEGLPEPVQKVFIAVEVPFEKFDWSGISPEEQNKKLDSYLKADRSKGFDLKQPPLLRIALLKTGPAAHKLVWTFHHALLDGTSYRFLLREVFSVYEALVDGRDHKHKQLRPYKDYIEWSESQDLGKAEAYWRAQLGDFDRPTPLVVDRHGEPDKAEATERAQYETELPAAVTASLRELTAANEFTLNTVVQAAWALVLSAYSSEEDVVFGATRACRHSTLEGVGSMLGLFINTIPMRVSVEGKESILDLLNAVRKQHVALREFENTPLVKIQEWSGTGPGAPLFESIIVFNNYELNSDFRALGGKWENRDFQAIEQTNFPLTLFAYGESKLLLRLVYDESRFEKATISRLTGHLVSLLTSIAVDPEQLISQLCLLTGEERKQMLGEWNDTGADYERDACIHHLFESQAERTPGSVALAFEDRELTYSEVNQQANQLAGRLLDLGVGPDVLVGVCVKRSPEMVVSLLAILKSGGAYVPLDPEYPAERLEFMIQDANISVLLTEPSLGERFADTGVNLVNVKDPKINAATNDDNNISSKVASGNLAYVIYTSGSTGVPKGVMVEHRNVVNFFRAIDDQIGTDPGVWLAVTSISFDISVMELLWTLTRGYKVVIQGGSSVSTYSTDRKTNDNPIGFSLFYFASDYGEDNEDKYRLLLEGAQFADTHEFEAVWTPERHFHAFGGLYPNPAVTGAAVAAITQNVRIRAGSVVLPLHDPVRVAEEWAVVDNISKGRVDLAFASGWHASDFAFAPENYSDRYKVMERGVETIRGLWRGESITRTSGDDSEVQIKVFPKPLQNEIPIWMTAAGNPKSFRSAGETGANLLTNLLGQSIDDLAEKIRIYREARKESGHGPAAGKVTLMLHTFVGADLEFVREKVRNPFTDYLKTSVNLIKNAPWAFPAFNRESRAKAKQMTETLGQETVSDTDLDTLAAHAFERYFETSGLFGTPETCLDLVNRLKEIGVDEIACLIDFNVDADSVLEGLEHLNELRELSNSPTNDYSIPAQIERHHVTHMQCTPSAARLMASDGRTLESLKSLKHLALGGEALPENLVSEISAATSATIHNMYGPTETTIWSTASTLKRSDTTVSIGTPLANTRVYILNKELQPVPIGIPGELYIGGDGVTRGYLDRPELTKDMFIPSPFNQGKTQRLYKTGDLAAYRPDGTIDFIGRVDNQVKLRGYRVELNEIQTALDAYPAVQQSVVHVREDSSEGKSLVAYVVPQPNGRGKQQTNQIEGWKSVWDEAYGQPAHSSISTRNFAGWNSSYDGNPIPEAEMNEWLEGTVSKILADKPSRVLEIGCGTGLLLFRIAPACEEYLATDFSKTALDHLGNAIDQLDVGLPQVRLLEKSADDFSDLPDAHFDTVVLNSVIQYFPDSGYLMKILRGALEAVKPGGTIFIGDVRSLPLLEAFHLSVETHRAADDESCVNLKENVKKGVEREQELVFAPKFFEDLHETFDNISGVEITLRDGSFVNELTKFRYDVRIKVNSVKHEPIYADWIIWDKSLRTLQDIRALIKNSQDEIIAVSGVPNQRLQFEFAALELLNNTSPPESVSGLRDSLAKNEAFGLDPADLLRLGKESGFSVSVRWSPAGPDRFDVVFSRGEIATEMIQPPQGEKAASTNVLYTNHPTDGSSKDLTIELREYLTEKLPPYMVPSSFQTLDVIPLTPNGKIDRAALPAPKYKDVPNKRVDKAPTSDLEKAVANLWAEMLGIDQVGTNQSFFHVGGHSLLATQLVTRLKSVFQVELSLREIFDFPTVAGIASCLTRLESQPGQSEKIAGIMNEIDQMPIQDTEARPFKDGLTR